VANTPKKKYSSKDLQKWLFDRALEAASATARRIVFGNDQRKRDTAVWGKMYFFRYDPKWKNILPVYDMAPLVLPIEMYNDGFLGLNLHYLTSGEREALLNELMKYRSNKLMNDTTKLRVTYQLLSSTKKLESLSRPCIKRYLFSHVRSKFIEILPDEWDKAIQLPVANWVSKE
jgi:hypothetical protein